tara:strand:+ start:997 stop:2058 length:1062 start_codon:yes stop_codon:yes gene_type:complete
LKLKSNEKEFEETPGLVDLQVNGFGGVDFNSPDLTPEKLQKSLEAMLTTGVSTCLPTIITASEENMKNCLSNLENSRESIPLAKSMIAGYHLEGPFISKLEGFSGCHPIQHISEIDYEMFLRLQEAAEGKILMITLAPELEGSIEFIEKVVSEEIIVALGHTNASSEKIRSAIDAGASISSHLGNGTSTKLNKNKNPIIAQLSEDRLYASFIADGFHLDPEVLKVYLRAKGTERIIITTDATAGAFAPPGKYKFGYLDLLVGNEPVVLNKETSRPIGSAVTLDRCVCNLINWYGTTLEEAVKWAGTNGKKLLTTSKTLSFFVNNERKVWWKKEDESWYIKKAQCGNFVFLNEK